MKKNQGIKINENMLNSLILGHVEARDMPKIPLTTVHYNALLRVHLENGNKFRPEQVLEDMRKHGAAPDKETYQCLISRHCQEGDIEGASKVLQLMKNQGIKINENMFNSLILGHREAGDLLKDWKFLEKEMAKEMTKEDQVYSDNDYMLELLLSKCGNKEDTAKLLSLTISETEM